MVRAVPRHVAVARLVPAPLRRRVAWKVMAPFAVLSLVVAFLGSYLTTQALTGSLEERFTNQLAEAARVASDAVVRRESEHLAMIRSVTFTEGVPEAIVAADGAALERVIVPLAANSGTELVAILDAAGSPLVAVRLADANALRYEAAELAEPQAWEPVRRVLAGEVDESGDKFAGIVQAAGGLALYSASPIVADDRLVAVVLVGSPLDSFLPVAKGEALADVTLYDSSGRPLSTSFPFASATLGAELAPGIVGMAPGTRERRTLFGREYELLYGALRVRGEPVGFYSVALPTQFITVANSATRVRLGVLFAAGTLAVLMAGWLISLALTTPLAALVRATQQMARGDLTARSGISREDEIGALASSFDLMAETLEQQHMGALEALVSAIDARDAYTRGHSVRVGHLAKELGAQLGLDATAQQHLLVGGYLHDIGKIGVRDEVLLKPGQLSKDERLSIQEHPRIGLAILEPVGLPAEVIAGVGGHHERLDGSGYPRGLAGDDVSIYPRIVTVADVYDALITDRPYRGALPIERVFAILDEEVERGLIDGAVVEAMRAVAPSWEARRKSDPALGGFQLEASNVTPLVQRRRGSRAA
jgi:putative nucleotidyltransferase with HDIG domain